MNILLFSLISLHFLHNLLINLFISFLFKDTDSDEGYSTSTSTSSNIIEKPKIKSKKLQKSLTDLIEKLDCLSELLKGRPFKIPKNTSFLQKKILSQFYEEMSRKCEGDLLKINFSRVFSVLPMALRQLFVNSYQSLLWNEAAIARFNSNTHNIDNNNNIYNNKYDNDNNNNDKDKEINKHNDIYNKILNNLNNNVFDSIISPVTKTEKVDTIKKTENSYSKNTIVELKIILKDKGLKLSGKKSELISRLLEFENSNNNNDNNDNNNNNNNTKNDKKNDNNKNYNNDNNNDNNSNNDNNNNDLSVDGFLTSDTAIVGDIVLVNLKKEPLTAWHVSAQNISLNGNHIPIWSESVGAVKITEIVPAEKQIINSNSPYNSNPNSPFYKDPNAIINNPLENNNERGGGRGGRRGERRGERGSSYDFNEVEEIREIKACYHIVTR